jgi:hypothetical protein
VEKDKGEEDDHWIIHSSSLELVARIGQLNYDDILKCHYPMNPHDQLIDGSQSSLNSMRIKQIVNTINAA